MLATQEHILVFVPKLYLFYQKYCSFWGLKMAVSQRQQVLNACCLRFPVSLSDVGSNSVPGEHILVHQSHRLCNGICNKETIQIHNHML